MSTLNSIEPFELKKLLRKDGEKEVLNVVRNSVGELQFRWNGLKVELTSALNCIRHDLVVIETEGLSEMEKNNVAILKIVAKII